MCFLEIIDPETGQCVHDGKPSEILLTQFDLRGTIVLRYRTGGLIEKNLTYEPCPHCGRSCPLLPALARKNLTGLRFRKPQHRQAQRHARRFQRLENILDDTEGLGAWQVELCKRNDDPLESDIVLVHAVIMKGDEAQLHEAIHDRFKSASECATNEIQFHTWEKMRRMQRDGKQPKEQN